jgi:beta-lactamase regulating signal transducer with metallopeptidase domain
MAGGLLHILSAQSWQIAVLFALVAVASVFLRAASAHWRYLLWLVVLIKCLIPPIVSLPLPAISDSANQFLPRAIAPAQPAQDNYAGPDTLAANPQQIVTAQSQSLAKIPSHPPIWERIDWSRWLLIAWASSALTYLLVAFLRAWRIQQGLTHSRTWPDMELECEFLELTKTVGTRFRPKLCLIRGLSQPFVWGLLRGAIYLPENFGVQGTLRERKLVMAHELAHVLRWDALVNFVQVLVQAIFIFHPLVWLLNRLIRHEREKCCDEMAVAILHSPPEEYGSAILNRLADYFEPACPPSSLAISGRAKDLEDRIKSLLRPGRSFSRQPTIPAKVTILLLALLVLPLQVVVKAKPRETTTANSSTIPTLTLVDLTSFTNASLRNSWLPATTDDDLAALAIGRQTLGGVPFQVDGIVQLSGTPGEAAAGFPTAIKNIKIDRSFSKLHLLHACAGKESDGVVIAKIIIHYTDGLQRELPIAYGSQARDWQFWDFEALNDSESAMAWTGENLFVRAQKGSLRLYRTTWTNPRPQSQVAGIDYTSAQSRSAPFMVALSVE